jgi:hypothetical protein
MRQNRALQAISYNGNNGKRPPGRPRSEQSRRAILRSTLKLLQKKGGFSDLGIEAIAADAFAESSEQELQFPDTGTVIGDMSLQMRRLIRIFRSDRGKIVAALLAAGQSDPELLEAFRERFLWPRRLQAYKTLQRGIDRRELPRGSDMDLILDSLYGPIYMRFLIRHDELTENFADQLCALVLSGSQRQ